MEYCSTSASIVGWISNVINRFMNKILRSLKVIFLTFFIFNVLGLISVLAVGDKIVTVSVKDENNDGVAGINVTLSGPGGYTPNTIPTSTNGNAIFDDIEDNGEYTATISLPTSSEWKLASGEAGSKSAQISNSNKVETLSFDVVAKTDEQETTPKILEVKLPGAFTKVGSSSTDLSKINSEDVAAVENFTLDDPTANKIVFLEPVDLSDDALAEKFAELDTYVSIGEEGRVLLDSVELPALNKKAQITMRNLSLTSSTTPVIVEDGEVSSKVSNTKYSNGLLTFDVSSFSSFAFRPTLKVEAEEQVTNPSFTINGEVNDLEAKIDIYLGEERIAEELDPDDEGKFVFAYSLVNAENNFKVIASSLNGEVADVEFTTNFTGGAQNAEKKTTSPFLLIALIGGVLAGIVAAVYFINKSKKNKSLTQPRSEGLKDIETPNPPMPIAEKQDIAGDKIGSTDLGPISNPENDSN